MNLVTYTKFMEFAKRRTCYHIFVRRGENGVVTQSWWQCTRGSWRAPRLPSVRRISSSWASKTKDRIRYRVHGLVSRVLLDERPHRRTSAALCLSWPVDARVLARPPRRELGGDRLRAVQDSHLRVHQRIEGTDALVGIGL